MALPSGYTRLRYIQSSGTQYINTGFKPNQNTRVVMDIQAVGASGTYFAFGARQSNTSNAFCLFFYNGWAADYQTSNQRKTFPSIAFTDRLEIDFNKTVCTVNGQTATFTAATFQSPVEMMLLAVNTNGTIANKLAAKLYACQIYDNGTLVRDFVPAKNSSGTAGLYDTAKGVFYTNAGSGAFEAGPLVTGPVDGDGVTILAGVSFAIKEGTAMLNGVARKITEGMTILEGAAKKIAVASGIDVAAMVIGYTGAYTDKTEVTMSGKKYRLLTLTGSGTLTVAEKVKADVWLCSGGCGGIMAGGGGGGGGYVLEKESVLLTGSVVCTVGVGGNVEGGFGGVSSIGSSIVTKRTDAYINGGSGGGSGGYGGAAGKGAGISTVPFRETTLFDRHSAGGGGGGYYYNDEDNFKTYASGGNGGSNGVNGGARNGNANSATGGTGGVKGGGTGGNGARTALCDGGAATFYGSGGGGGGEYDNEYTGTGRTGASGAGYQGVIYVRIPYEQE